MKKTINLTRVDGCYSKELREMCPAIKLAAKEPSISTSDMRDMVICIIEPAYIKAAAKKRFVENLRKCETKADIEKLCHEAVIHGMYYHPKAK